MKSARKQYVCDYCDEVINVGDPYYRGYASVNNLSFEFFISDKSKDNGAIHFVDGDYRIDNKVLFNAYNKTYHGK